MTEILSNQFHSNIIHKNEKLRTKALIMTLTFANVSMASLYLSLYEREFRELPTTQMKQEYTASTN